MVGRPKGLPKTGGRKPGTRNNATLAIKEIANKYTEEAVGILVSIARSSDSDAARVSAIKEILDRGHGKPSQPVGGDNELGPIKIEVGWLASKGG